MFFATVRRFFLRSFPTPIARRAAQVESRDGDRADGGVDGIHRVQGVERVRGAEDGRVPAGACDRAFVLVPPRARRRSQRQVQLKSIGAATCRAFVAIDVQGTLHAIDARLAHRIIAIFPRTNKRDGRVEAASARCQWNHSGRRYVRLCHIPVFKGTIFFFRIVEEKNIVVQINRTNKQTKATVYCIIY